MSIFVHLHGHSYFSNGTQIDALSSPEEIVERASEIGMKAIAITDHASVMSAPRFVKAAEGAGIKPIIGAELYVTNDLAWRPEDASDRTRRKYKHLVALARNWDGFIELMGLLSKANDRNDGHFYSRPRNSIEEVRDTRNLIFLTACAGGLLCDDDAEKDVQALVDAGRSVFLEIQPHWHDAQHAVNAKAVALSEKLGLPLVATQDFHYALEGQNIAHEVLLANGQGKSWTNPDRWKYPVDDLFIKDQAQMLKAFSRHVRDGVIDSRLIMGAISNTEKIADIIDIEWRKMDISLPVMSATPDRDLMMLCLKSLKERGLASKPEYVERLKYEFKVIQESGFLMYFLVLHDIIEWAEKNGIVVGPGRGSSGGSLVCYLIGITKIDPILHGLLFERFYRPGRIDLPDIDTDFEDERRGEVIDYIQRRFGSEYVSNVANYMMFGAKSAIKAAARVFEIDGKETNIATTQVDNLVPDEEVWDDDAIRPYLDKYPLVEQQARQLVGTMSGMGQHAAGVVVAGVPLSERTVVWEKDGRKIACWDKRVIEDMGLMKLDVLGLRTLSILRNAVENVFRIRGKKIELTDVPLDDEQTLAVFQEGKTTGVFQFESSGMRRMLQSLRVNSFSVIADANALYRPGPMELIPRYTAAQTGRTKPIIDHPILEPILMPTNGVMVYQEQLMKVFVDMGGFSYSDADRMRKIVSKSMGPDEFRKHEQAFVDGAISKGVDEHLARKIFGEMVAFGGYAFNKSHAVAYSILAYWCAYMKAHYPAEFYAAHISNSHDGQTMLAVEEASRFDIRVAMPDVNKSEASKFTVVTETLIQAPLTAIKGLGPKAAELIVKARKGIVDDRGLTEGEIREGKTSVEKYDPKNVRAGEFVDRKDFMKRVYKRIVNSKVQRLLDETGTTPWTEATDDEQYYARIEHLGHIFKNQIAIDPDEFIDLDEATITMLDRAFQPYKRDIQTLTHGHKTLIGPANGSKPRFMLVFEKPGWKDERKGFVANDDAYEYVRKLFADELGFTFKDYYVTTFYKVYKPAVGYEEFDVRSEKVLQDELEQIKPPLVIAFGKRPIEFFAGKGSRVPELHGKTVMKGTIPVLCCMSPWQAIMDVNNEETFKQIVDGLRAIL